MGIIPWFLRLVDNLDAEIREVLIGDHPRLAMRGAAADGLRLPLLMFAPKFIRLENFQVHARIFFGADRFQKNTESTGGLALTADNISHVVLINMERNEHAPVIHGPFGPDILWMINKRLYGILNELLILIRFSHNVDVNELLLYWVKECVAKAVGPRRAQVRTKRDILSSCQSIAKTPALGKGGCGIFALFDRFLFCRRRGSFRQDSGFRLRFRSGI